MASSCSLLGALEVLPSLLLHPSNSQYDGNFQPCNSSSLETSLPLLWPCPVLILNIHLFCYTRVCQGRVAPLLPLYKSDVHSLLEKNAQLGSLHYKWDVSALGAFQGQMLQMVRSPGSVEQVQGNRAVI